VHGGGRLIHDPAADRYAGAVEIALGPTWTLRGVGVTEARPGGGTSTLVSATLERDAVSPGFEVTGFGFLIALHRRGDGDAMRAALTSGELDALMFPPDPLGRTAELVAALGRMFPPADDLHVVGLMLRLSFAGGLVTAKVGLLVQFATGPVHQTKVFVALSAVLAPPAPLDRVLYVKVLGVGEYDAATGELNVRARLVDSRLCGADLLGEAVAVGGELDDLLGLGDALLQGGHDLDGGLEACLDFLGGFAEAVGEDADVGGGGLEGLAPGRGVGDERAEQAEALGEGADRVVGLVVDAHGDELGQRGAVLVEHAEGPVAGVDERHGRLGDALQRGVQVEVRPDGEHGVEEATQAARPHVRAGMPPLRAHMPVPAGAAGNGVVIVLPE